MPASPAACAAAALELPPRFAYNSRMKSRRRKAASRRRAVALLFLLLAAGGGAVHFTGLDVAVPGLFPAPAFAPERQGGDSGGIRGDGDDRPAAAPPLVQAETIKFLPEDPGGLEIPHRDKQVFTRLAAPGSGAGGATDAPARDSGAQDPAAQYVVELDSFPGREDAEAALSRLRQRFPGLLAATPLHIQSADLGSLGSRHRVRAGAFAGRAQARSLCLALRSHGQRCRVSVR